MTTSNGVLGLGLLSGLGAGTGTLGTGSACSVVSGMRTTVYNALNNFQTAVYNTRRSIGASLQTLGATQFGKSAHDSLYSVKVCQAGCESDTDCASGQSCVSGACQTPSVDTAGGMIA